MELQNSAPMPTQNRNYPQIPFEVQTNGQDIIYDTYELIEMDTDVKLAPIVGDVLKDVVGVVGKVALVPFWVVAAIVGHIFEVVRPVVRSRPVRHHQAARANVNVRVDVKGSANVKVNVYVS